MASRLSQKQVEEMFYEQCRYAKVPAKAGKKMKGGGYSRGFFSVGYAYGMMRIEWIAKCGGMMDVSGYRGAREMYTWLQNFNYRGQYRYYRKWENGFCESMAKRRARQGG